MSYAVRPDAAGVMRVQDVRSAGAAVVEEEVFVSGSGWVAVKSEDDGGVIRWGGDRGRWLIDSCVTTGGHPGSSNPTA